MHKISEQLGLVSWQIDDDIARGISHDMMAPLVDNCPQCHGEWRVGDYVCWDTCPKCFQQAMDEASEYETMASIKARVAWNIERRWLGPI